MFLHCVGDGCTRGSFAILWYSRLRVERRGNYHGFNRGHGHLPGVWDVRRAVRRVEEMSNHLVRALVVTLVWLGGKVKSASVFLTVAQSRRAQCGVSGGSRMNGSCIITTIGTCVTTLR